MELSHTYFRDNDRDSPIYQAALEILADHIEHPDEGSRFEKVVSKMGGTGKGKVARLLPIGFDALLGIKEDKIVGYLALRHATKKSPTGVFRVYTMEDHRGNGVAPSNIARLVTDCFERGEKRIFVSEGNDPKVIGCLKAFQRDYNGLYKVKVVPDIGLIERL